jgi:hypothetical protein
MDAVHINQKKDNGDCAELLYEIDDDLLYLTNHVGER